MSCPMGCPMKPLGIPRMVVIYLADTPLAFSSGVSWFILVMYGVEHCAREVVDENTLLT